MPINLVRDALQAGEAEKRGHECIVVNWSYLRESAIDQRLEEAPGKSTFRSLSLVLLGETNMAVLPLELRWLHLVVAVSYQKINTPVATNTEAFSSERAHVHGQYYDIFRNEDSNYAYIERCSRKKEEFPRVNKFSRFISFSLSLSIVLFGYPCYDSLVICFSVSAVAYPIQRWEKVA